jgi:hypothetical protein
MKNYIAPLAAALTLVACSNNKPPAPPATPANTSVAADKCSPIKNLIAEYAHGFTAIKASKVNNAFVTQWHANTHIIGASCTVTLNKSQQVSYQCQTPANTQQYTVSKHLQLAQRLRQCLTTQGWYESQKESVNAIYSTFVLDTQTPVITLATNQLSKGYTTRFEIAPPLGQ